VQVFREIQSVVVERESAVCIGNFDGLHLGHQALICELKKIAEQKNLATTLVLFEPQPLEFFAPEKAPARLLSLPEKLTVLQSLNIDTVVVLSFDAVLASMSAEVFVHDILLKALKMKHILVGENFRFGAKRQGDVDLLRQMSQVSGFDVTVQKIIALGDQRISSTEVRKALANSDFDKAEKLLGRRYCMSGTVVQGNQMGRKLGFPTANIMPDRLHCPVSGILVTQVHGLTKMPLKGAASLGIRPTVNGKAEVLEVYLLDFDQNIYGKEIRVEFLKKLRDEKYYETLEALTKQIEIDVKNVKNYFERSMVTTGN